MQNTDTLKIKSSLYMASSFLLAIPYHLQKETNVFFNNKSSFIWKKKNIKRLEDNGIIPWQKPFSKKVTLLSCGWHPHLALQTLKKLDKKGAPLLPSPKSFMLQGLIKIISIQSISDQLINEPNNLLNLYIYLII